MTYPNDALPEALEHLLDVVDDGFRGSALRIPSPGERRAIVRAADEARSALAALPNREDAPEPDPDEAAMFAFYTSPAASPGGKVKFWSELTDAERDHWRAFTTPYVPALVREDAPSREGLRDAAEAVIAFVPLSTRPAVQWQRNRDEKARTAIAGLRAAVAATVPDVAAGGGPGR